MTTWLTALTAWPLPAGPKWVIVLPIAASTGRARSTSAGSPPTKIVRVACLAPSEPPETGASTKPMPRVARGGAANAAVAAGRDRGAVDDEAAAARGPSATPSAPNRTASTSGVSETQHTTTSDARGRRRPASRPRARPARRASAARPGVRFQTVTSNPARRRFAAIAAPIVPSPTNPIRSTPAPPASCERGYPAPRRRARHTMRPMEWLGVERRRLGTALLVFGLVGMVLAAIIAAGADRAAASPPATSTTGSRPTRRS